MSITRPTYRQVSAAIVLAASTVLAFRYIRRLSARAAELQILAYRDPLTGIGNRRAGIEALDHGPVSVVGICDLDDFKLVNDRYGHAAGDQLLAVVAARLRAVVGNTGVVARLGGDEFLLIWYEGDRDDLGRGAAVLQALGEPVLLDDIVIRPSASLGIVAARPDAGPRQLLADADHATAHAKTTHGHIADYDLVAAIGRPITNRRR